MAKRPSSAKNPLLRGHKRDKKKLIPPIIAFPQTTFISSIDLIFPELIWIGLLLDWHGVREGIQVVSSLLHTLWTTESEPNWYRFSELTSGSINLTDLLADDEIDDLAVVFAALRSTYKLTGLDWAISHEDGDAAQRRVEAAVRKYVDRFEQPYLTMLATVMYSMGISDKLKFSAGIAAPDIEAIVSDWGSDRAQMAASSLRAFSLAFFPHDMDSKSEDWCKHFWRRNYQMTSCEHYDDAL